MPMFAVALEVQVVHVGPEGKWVAGYMGIGGKGVDGGPERKCECGGSFAPALDETITDNKGVVTGGAAWDVGGGVDSLPKVVEEAGKGWAMIVCSAQCGVAAGFAKSVRQSIVVKTSSGHCATA